MYVKAEMYVCEWRMYVCESARMNYGLNGPSYLCICVYMCVYVYVYVYIYLICTYLYFCVLLLVFSVICMHQGVRE